MEQISRRSMLTAIGGLSGAAVLAACSDEAEPSLGDDPSTTYHYADESGSGSSTSGTEGTEAKGELSTVTLDAPDDLQNRWAAYAAVWTAANISGEGTGPRVEGGDWVYEMEVGEWAWLVRRKDGKAVLVGQGEPDTRRSAAEEKKARSALLAGAPSWWQTYETAVPEFNSVGFILGWDGKKWQQAGAPGSRGGFAALTFYLASQERTGEQLARFASGGETGYSGSARVAADRIISAGPKVTASQLKALGPELDAKRLAAGVKAAKAFAGKGKR